MTETNNKRTIRAIKTNTTINTKNNPKNRMKRTGRK